MSSEQGQPPGLVILSIDSGGIRGLSSLLILKEIMTRLQRELGTENIPEVHEHFDFVGGTGTGGVSAAMLGRMKMPLDSAIKHFAKLAQDVFSDKKVFSTSSSGAFKSTKMQQALKQIVRHATGDENSRMLENRSKTSGCKTAVFAMSKHNMNTGVPRAFRSYQTSTNQMPDCTIWEALSATTAHPDLFKSIDISDGPVTESFVDGSLGCSNPLARLLSEVKLVYPHRHVGCIISVGAGHTRSIHIPRFSLVQRLLPTTVIQTTKAIATDSERVSQEMAIRFCNSTDIYFRFNVDQGMQSVELSDWERLDEVTSHTRGYLHLPEVSARMDKLTKGMRKKPKAISVAYIDGGAPTAVQRPVMSLYNRICPQPTPIFVGREHLVRQAAAYLLDLSTRQKVFVIHGLGGAGKTQIALRIVESTSESWSDIIYINAATDETIKTTLRDFAHAKGFGDAHGDTIKWLASGKHRCLLVFDNADDPALSIVTYVSQCRSSSIIITTRNPRVADLASGKDGYCKLSNMEPDESMQLLLRSSRQEGEHMVEPEVAAAKALLEDVGHLPLAIVQAAGYISAKQCSIAQYRNIYSNQPEKLLNYTAVRMLIDEYERTVFDTWLLSYISLSSLAKQLLWIISFLQRDRITMEIFERAAKHIKGFTPIVPLSSPELEAYNSAKEFLEAFTRLDNTWEADAFFDAIEQILSHSLIDYDRPTATYMIHPLVQTWARAIVPHPELGSLHTAYIIAASLNWANVSTPLDHSYCRSLQLHLDTIFEHGSSIGSDVAACLANVWVANGRWDLAQPVQEKVVVTRNQELGNEHKHTLSAMVSLAHTYGYRGRLEDAENLQAQVLSIWTRVLGEQNPNTLSVMNDLASTYFELGRLQKAEELRVHILDEWKKIEETGTKDPEALFAMNNLATTHWNRGRFKEAAELQSVVLNARTRVLGEEHSSTISTMNNLAVTLSDQGRLAEAAELQSRVLKIRTQTLGEDHPTTLSALNNLANTYAKQGHLADAEELRVLVLNTSKRVLGEEHPITLDAMNNLAVTRCDQGRLKAAQELHLKVLYSRKRALGDEHPATLSTMNNLASTYIEQGLLQETEELMLRVLSASKRGLGEEHPDTLSAMSNLAITYLARGRPEEAKALHSQVLIARKAIFGPQHSLTIQSMNNLARTYRALGWRFRIAYIALQKEITGIQNNEPAGILKTLHIVLDAFHVR